MPEEKSGGSRTHVYCVMYMSIKRAGIYTNKIDSYCTAAKDENQLEAALWWLHSVRTMAVCFSLFHGVSVRGRLVALSTPRDVLHR